MRAPALILVALAAALAMGASAGPPKWLVDHVRDEINDGRDPSDPDGPPVREPTAKMFRRVNINGDKLTDWKVDFGDQPGWCGTGGCRVELWLGRADGGVTPVWDAQVREFKLKRGKQGATVDVDFHGSACGGAGVMACPRRYVWSSTDLAFNPAVNARRDGFIAGLPVSPLDLTLTDAPKDVRDEARAMADLCRQAGGRMEGSDYGLTRLPDLNGDGIGEWAIGSEYADCAEPAQANLAPFDLEIMTSAPNGRFTLAWGATDPAIGFDLATRPTTMVRLVTDDDACGIQGRGACRGKPFRWDGASRKLTLAD